jgi:serine/threonine protein kinase
LTATRGQHLIGKVLANCVLEKLLGYGGSSAVFLGQQRYSEQKVAVKVFLPRANMDAKMQRDFYRRFLREAEAASKLDHPNILPIYAYGEEDGLPYIIMPYMPGGTLAEYIARRGALSLQEAQWYLEQITSALDYAHEHGCVHCDVKPANILLDNEGNIMLTDFGIARVMQPGSLTAQTISRGPESLMGTPDYISPEQAMGRALDGRSDIYSLGVTLFYMLANRLPFKADSTIALALLHVHEAPPSLALIRADITPDIDQVIQKALAKEPDRRFRTAGAFSAAFAKASAASEKLATVSLRHAHTLTDGSGHVGGGSQPAVVSSPNVRVRPIRNARLVRLGSAAVLFMLLVAGATFLVMRLTTQQTTVHSVISTTKVNAAMTATSNPGNVDYLTYCNDWPTSHTFFYDSQQRYHILNKSPQYVALALCQNQQFKDFSLSVSMQEIHTPVSSADFYGVIFRSTADQSHYYLFEIDPTGGGKYDFWRYDRNGKTNWTMLATGPTPSLVTAPGKSNIVTIQAKGDTFSFFINNQPVGKPVTDPSKSPLLSGKVGLYVEDQGAEVAFSHLYIRSVH